MTASDDLTYTTRTNGEVEILRGGSMALLLRGDDAQDFLAQVKDGDADKVMKSFVGEQSGAAETTGSNTHPAMERPLDGPTPHGDGEPRKSDGEERPTD